MIRIADKDMRRLRAEVARLRAEASEWEQCNASLAREISAQAERMGKAAMERDAAVARAYATEKERDEYRMNLARELNRSTESYEYARRVHEAKEHFIARSGELRKERDAARAYAGRWKALARRLRTGALHEFNERCEAQDVAVRLAASCNELVRTCEAERDAARAELAALRKAAWSLVDDAEWHYTEEHWHVLDRELDALSDALGARREGELW